MSCQSHAFSLTDISLVFFSFLLKSQHIGISLTCAWIFVKTSWQKAAETFLSQTVILNLSNSAIFVKNKLFYHTSVELFQFTFNILYSENTSVLISLLDIILQYIELICYVYIW